MKKHILKKIKNSFIFLCIVAGLFTLWANKTISSHSASFLNTHGEPLPDAPVALVLGTSKYLSNGQPNLYFDLRMAAASTLYHQGKVKYIIVSGDNRKANYNEPEQMKQDLVAQGVPEERIYLDYAGFRTLDSIVRAQEIFGQNKMIIVSQKFHNERAVFLARKRGIEAYGFNAQDVNVYSGFRTNVREVIARNKVFVDLIFAVEPKFLGEKIDIPPP